VTKARVPAGWAVAGGTIRRVWRETLDRQGLLDTPGDLAVAAVAERQDGVVSSAQLLAAGLGQGAIEHRVRRGRLHRIYRGVYAVGHRRLTPRGRLWAAVLACGGPEAAVPSHRTAAAVWDLLPSPAQFEITTRRESRPRPGIRVHRSRTLTAADITTHDGLPVTTVARTLLDLAATLNPHRLERVVHRAEHLRLLDMDQLPTRTPSPLRAALHTLATGDPQLTRSGLEERFLTLVLEAQLPRPEVNARVGGHEVDFLWRGHRLVVETDGAATHLTRAAFEEDRRRDAVLQVQGYRVLRFTWRQVVEQPRATIATVTRLLAADG
jgi:very-short-patch-repair endonuclease